MTEVLALLILLTVIAAIITVVTPNLLYAVISLGAVGFLLAIVFLFLAAPDIAIVQIGVEVVSLVILIRATLGRDKKMVKVSSPLWALPLRWRWWRSSACSASRCSTSFRHSVHR